ncbi:MAG: Hint domain-containing protein [Paenirhodobacter sp.]|uniref:Hint domain-containing protein n=1 Tax=Paenirhodobacter sp. TaxID=1965326 RepID=UPI003D141B01
MATYVFNGYYGGDFLIEGGGNVLNVGSRFMLDPTWDVSTDVRSFTFTDDDGNIAGDNFADEHGNDSNQYLTVHDASGNVIASGQAYLESAAVFTAPDGSTITMYIVEINGAVVGEITSAPLQPGVTYQVSSIPDVTTGPTYTSISSTTYDPDLANNIEGGTLNDSLYGGAGDDTIAGGAGADTIDGGTGNDTIYFGTGGDLVHGGDGNDVIDDYAGSTGYVYNDTIYGDAGNDTIWAGAGNDWVDGGADNDLVYGEDGDDTIYGGTGNDTLYGEAGNDQLHGGDGADYLSGGLGNDTLYGDAGRDTLTGGAGNDVLYGGADEDVFTFYDGFGSDTVWGDSLAGTTSDTDTLDFSALSSAVNVTFTGSEDGGATNGANTVSFDNIEAVVGTGYADRIDATLDASGLSLSGGGGDDTILGGAGADTISGGSGNDTISGGAGADVIDGGAGNDTIDGGTGADTITGGTGNDSILGGADADVIRIAEGDGTDTIFGGETGTDSDTLEFTGSGVQVTMTGPESGSWTMTGSTGSFSEIEAVSGTAGADTLDASAVSGGGVNFSGGAGDDSLLGGSGADTLSGGDGADTLRGGAGNDTISGDAGADLLQGGSGNDVLSGGSGADVFDFDDGSGADTVTDFDMTVIGGLTTDQLDVSDLHDGTGNPVNAWDVTVTDDGSGNAVLTFPGGESVTLLGVSATSVNSAPVLHSMGIPCIVAGTPIATPQGPVAIERLCPGDLVLTRDGAPLPVLWAGQRRVSAAQMRAEPRLLPVEIAAGAFGNAAPVRFSRQHGLYMPEGAGGALARAGHLAQSGWGGARLLRGLARPGGDAVTYCHLLLERHALIAAGGIWVESFWPGPFGFAALSVTSRQALIRSLPALVPGVFGLAPVENAYSLRIRPFLPRCKIHRSACAQWSRLARTMTFFDGFVT